MKTAIQILALLLTVTALNSQTVINITQNTTFNQNQSGNQFSNYTVNIADGVTLTVDMDVYLQNTTFNGGNVVVKKKLTFWSAGYFNNTKVIFNNGSDLVTSGVLTIKNSEFEFNGNSTATIWTSLELNNSTIRLNNDASLLATSGNFNIRNGSKIVVGDGTTGSKAFIKFNGATLNEFDNSFVTIANSNNYYFNWAKYNAIAVNKAITTVNNTLNCNLIGKNSCSAPVVYGPATLSYAGVSSSAVLPVKLTSFGVKASGNQTDITWTTDAEVNASHFIVERSFDAKEFTAVGTVKANGNTGSVSNYDYKDVVKVSGKYYYRLKMVDADGSFEYSPVRAINAEGKVEMNVYPNPAVNYIVINTKNGAADKLNVQIFTLAGQMIKQINGNGNSVISLNGVPSGSYVIKVINGQQAGQSFRMVKK